MYPRLPNRDLTPEELAEAACDKELWDQVCRETGSWNMGCILDSMEILKAKLCNLDPNFPGVTEEFAEITAALDRLVDVYVPEREAIHRITGYDA
jgi:hypothetical protein